MKPRELLAACFALFAALLVWPLLSIPNRPVLVAGGLVPIVTTSMYLSTGSVGWALMYTIVAPAVMFLIASFVMPETRKHSIWEEGAIEATRVKAKA